MVLESKGFHVSLDVTALIDKKKKKNTNHYFASLNEKEKERDKTEYFYHFIHLEAIDLKRS